MSEADGKCDDCGQFMKMAAPATWADQYSFHPPGCDYIHFRCERCTEKRGPVASNARPHNGDMRPYQGVFAE